MCGRLTVNYKGIQQHYSLRDDYASSEDRLKTRYNVTPGSELAVITKDGEKKLVFMRWGLIPFWAKDPKIGYKLINARAETVFEKPMWRKAIKSRRCLVPASGFYEWQKTENGKQPHHIKPKNVDLFSFAGVYDKWKNIETGEIVYSFSIITTKPNQEMSEVHDRAPVILTPDQEQLWLDESDDDLIQELIQPMADDVLDIVRVSKDVNSPRNDHPGLLDVVTS